MGDYEIWAHRSNNTSGVVGDHSLLLDGLDRTTADTIMGKITRNVIIGGVVPGGAPDVAVYLRKKDDGEYAIRVNGNTVRTRYTHESAKSVFDYYVNTLRKCRRRGAKLQLVMIKNASSRNTKINFDLLQVLLGCDSVYGSGDVAPARAPPLMIAPAHTRAPVLAHVPLAPTPARAPLAPTPARSIEDLFAIVNSVDVAALKRRLIRTNREYWSPIFEVITGRQRRPRVRRPT